MSQPIVFASASPFCFQLSNTLMYLKEPLFLLHLANKLKSNKEENSKAIQHFANYLHKTNQLLQ
jgi:hypothetical protein